MNSIKSVDFCSLSNIEIPRGKQLIYDHYRGILKPILLNHHLGKLNHNWKYNFLMYIVNQNYNSSKEIVWEELCNLYPGQSLRSLSTYLCQSVSDEQKENKNLDFREAVKKHAAKIRNVEDYNESQKEYRQKIVDVYLKCTLSVDA